MVFSKRPAAALALGFIAGACGGNDEGPPPLPPQSWVLMDQRVEPIGLHSQGLADVPAIGPDEFIFTSRISIDRSSEGEVAVSRFGFPSGLEVLEFDHMGDPDAHGSLVYVGLEDNSEPHAGGFHRGFAAYDAGTLDPVGWAHDPGDPDQEGDGDAPWVAISPDGRWLVTAEWNPMRRLIVYRTESVVSGHEVAPEKVISIENSPRSIQGCDFDGPRLLICASDDGSTGRQIYAVNLSLGLSGKALAKEITATVQVLFPAPLPEGSCSGEPETEGVDVAGDTLRVLMIGPCLDSHLYRYVRG